MPTFHVRIGELEFAVSKGSDGNLRIDHATQPIEIRKIADGSYSVLLNGESHTIGIGSDGDAYLAVVNGVLHEVAVETDRQRLMKSLAHTGRSESARLEIHAPMPALVSKVEVAVGDAVEKGSGLIILEAMKMENEIKAHHAARVKEIYVAKGKAVEKGELLMLLEEHSG